ncbi:hypothetical protein GPALN_004521 [Globodera pallida]|nr:hypothetical protein GPALN_004521 [Globodera pallida]
MPPNQFISRTTTGCDWAGADEPQFGSQGGWGMGAAHPEVLCSLGRPESAQHSRFETQPGAEQKIQDSDQQQPARVGLIVDACDRRIKKRRGNFGKLVLSTHATLVQCTPGAE